MLNNKKFIFFVIFLQACASKDYKDSGSKNDNFSLSATHCTINHEEVSKYRPNDKMVLLFPSLPGIIFGSPGNDIVQHITTLPNKDFLLELPTEMGSKAEKLSHKGLSIEPTNTKVIRLGTFHAYPTSENNNIGGGMFIDLSDKQPYMLIYFSQSASLTGAYSSQYGDTSFDIKNARKGWNWVKSVKKGNKDYHVTLRDNQHANIQFCALLSNTVNT